MKWWRRIPGWHRRETSFRDWYVGLLDRVRLDGDDAAYARAVEILKCPEDVTGYREIRYPKQDRAMAQVESQLGGGGPASREAVTTDPAPSRSSSAPRTSPATARSATRNKTARWRWSNPN
jgi:indolepyruvate ferredoxin oxidoreductase